MGKKKTPANMVGKMIKTARLEREWTVDMLVNNIIKNPKITVNQVKSWEKGKAFPDLDCIYLLAEALDLNPNEMLDTKHNIQEEAIGNVDMAKRRIGEKIWGVFFFIIKFIIKYLAAIVILYLALTYGKFQDMMTNPNDPKQIEYIEKFITNAVEEFTDYTYDEGGNIIKNYNNDNNEINQNTINQNIINN